MNGIGGAKWVAAKIFPLFRKSGGRVSRPETMPASGQGCLSPRALRVRLCARLESGWANNLRETPFYKVS